MKINSKIAIQVLLGILSILLLFHFSILFKIIPYEITWGGRLENDAEMYVFELTSILINTLILMVLLVRGKILKWSIPPKLIQGLLWVFFFLFALNTVGNLLAKTTFEKFFAIITVLNSTLLWVVIRRR